MSFNYQMKRMNRYWKTSCSWRNITRMFILSIVSVLPSNPWFLLIIIVIIIISGALIHTRSGHILKRTDTLPNFNRTGSRAIRRYDSTRMTLLLHDEIKYKNVWFKTDTNDSMMHWKLHNIIGNTCFSQNTIIVIVKKDLI